jgi:hypothetical protein
MVEVSWLFCELLPNRPRSKGYVPSAHQGVLVGVQYTFLVFGLSQCCAFPGITASMMDNIRGITLFIRIPSLINHCHHGPGFCQVSLMSLATAIMK